MLSLSSNPAKTVDCHFVSRLSADINLLSWAASLEYNTVRRLYCGAKAGGTTESRILMVCVFEDLLAKLKEPVVLQVHFPRVSFDAKVFEELSVRQPHISIKPVEETEIRSDISNLLDAEEYYAFGVVAQHEVIRSLKAPFEIFQLTDEWVRFFEDGDSKQHSVDCHRSLFVAMQQELPSLPPGQQMDLFGA